jgi:hypothetical protein
MDILSALVSFTVMIISSLALIETLVPHLYFLPTLLLIKLLNSLFLVTTGA